MPGKPTYDLGLVQQCVGQGTLTSSITAVAAAGASELGWSLEHIVEAVLLLSPADFYKTMEAERVPGLWQDVYHPAAQGCPSLHQGADGTRRTRVRNPVQTKVGQP